MDIMRLVVLLGIVAVTGHIGIDTLLPQAWTIMGHALLATLTISTLGIGIRRTERKTAAAHAKTLEAAVTGAIRAAAGYMAIDIFARAHERKEAPQDWSPTGRPLEIPESGHTEGILAPSARR